MRFGEPVLARVTVKPRGTNLTLESLEITLSFGCSTREGATMPRGGPAVLQLLVSRGHVVLLQEHVLLHVRSHAR